MRISLTIVLLTLMACNGGQSKAPGWVKPPSTVLGCDDYRSITIENAVLYNNVWNKHADQSGTGTQCLETREINGTRQYGWSWSWPAGKRTVYGYPQIKAGSSPWAPEPSADARFPAQISQLNTLRLSYDLEIMTNATHNVATTMWLIKEPLQRDKPNPSFIAAEVMVWTYSTKGHFDPAGKRVTNIQFGGGTWEVWVDKNWRDVSGLNENRWAYITFRSTQQLMSAQIDLLHLLKYAAEQNLITTDLYVADIELGNEVMSGAGLTWVKSFNVTLE